MSKSFRAVLIVAIGLAPTNAEGQGMFGRAVAASPDGSVLVMKPASGQGPAAVYVFDHGADGWSIRQELHGVGGVQDGHGLSPSIAVFPGALLLASGDPQVAFGAHVFRADAGGWMPDGRIALTDGPVEQAGQLDLAGLMRIMQPAQRVVAMGDNLVAIGVTGGLPAANGLRVFSRAGGRWTRGTSLVVPGVADGAQLGASVVVNGETVVAGAPRHGGTGAVFVFQSSDDGWVLSDSIIPTDLASNAGFGTALAFHGDALLVSSVGGRGAPGAVMRYTEAAGMWIETDRVLGTTPGPTSRFGAALAVVDDELFVGAPMADGGRGAVFGFSRAAGEWVNETTLGSGLPGARTLYGSSIAATSDILVAGAPLAAGMSGRAVVRTRTEESWSDPVILEAGGALASVTGQEVICEDGKASGFDCSNVDLLAFLPLEALGAAPGERVSDIWGWTDPETGREFALVGRTGGPVFVDVTDPANPVRIGELPANPSGARDLKVYRDHLFFTGDGAGQHGLQVFNLARLRDVTDPPAVFEPDAVYDGIASAHNLIMDEENGFAFPVGASAGGETCGGGLHMVDVREPLNPVFAGCYTDTEGLIYAGRTHDGQCVAYRGPDENYQGKQLCFASNETALRIVDVSDKSNPTPIAAASYPGIAYAHQGWLTDDHRYFYLNDELDELVGTADRTRTLVWDIAELDDPVMIGEFFGPNGSTDHNLYVKGDRMYQANYQAGLRVIDISDPENPVEVGFFDTTPYEGDPPGFVGAWTAYPYFESGTVIVSSMNEGLFILRPRPSRLIP